MLEELNKLIEDYYSLCDDTPHYQTIHVIPLPENGKGKYNGWTTSVTEYPCTTASTTKITLPKDFPTPEDIKKSKRRWSRIEGLIKNVVFNLSEKDGHYTLTTVAFFTNGTKTVVHNSSNDEIEVEDYKGVKVASERSKELGIIYCIIKYLLGKTEGDEIVSNGYMNEIRKFIASPVCFDQNRSDKDKAEEAKIAKEKYKKLQEDIKKRKAKDKDSKDDIKKSLLKQIEALIKKID